MGFSLGGSASIGNMSGSTVGKEEEEQVGIKVGNSTTVNSGRVDVGQVMGSSGTSGSQNSIVTGGSSSSTFNSGRTDTSQVMLDEKGLNYIAQGLMEGNQGLAAISKGTNSSGGYNSTVGTLLANDLLARISGEVAVRGAKTVNKIGSSYSTTQNSGNTVVQNIGGSNSYNNQETKNTVGASTSTTASEDQMASSIMKDKSETTNKTEKQATTKVGWILCTELVKQGRMDKSHYIPGLRVFQGYSAEVHAGYYVWAIPMLAHLKSKPFSLLSRIVCKLLCARAAYIASESGHKTARKTVLGFFAKQLVHVCYAIGFVIKSVEVFKSSEV